MKSKKRFVSLGLFAILLFLVGCNGETTPTAAVQQPSSTEQPTLTAVPSTSTPAPPTMRYARLPKWHRMTGW